MLTRYEISDLSSIKRTRVPYESLASYYGTEFIRDLNKMGIDYLTISELSYSDFDRLLSEGDIYRLMDRDSSDLSQYYTTWDTQWIYESKSGLVVRSNPMGLRFLVEDLVDEKYYLIELELD